MKRILAFSIVVLLNTSIVYCQKRNSLIYSSPQQNHLNEEALRQTYQDIMNGLDFNNYYQEGGGPKSVLWNWDTIITYKVEGGKTRFSQSLNINNKPIILLREIWQDTIWINSSKENFSYDTNGNLETHLVELWQNNAWINNWLKTMTYDSFGNNITLMKQEWGSGSWMNYSMVTNTYIDNKYISTETHDTWDSVGWKDQVRYSYVYDISHNLISKTETNWINVGWKNQKMKIYSYDNTGNKLTELTQQWNEFTNSWDNLYLSSYTYDATGKTLIIESANWQGGSWVKIWRGTNIYDLDENLVSEISDNWLNNSWQNVSFRTFTYDIFGNSLTGENKYYQSGTWFPSNSSINLYSKSSLNYILYNLYEIYRYEAHFTSTLNHIGNLSHGRNQLIVFPNPAVDKISVRCLSSKKHIAGVIRIYTLRGEQIMMQPFILERPEIKVGCLPKGVYLLELLSETMNWVTRFVKD